MRGLLIGQPWIDLILAGRKTWEIRGSATRVRGPIALIESGSGTVVGVCKLTDCVGPLTLEEFHGAQPRWSKIIHCGSVELAWRVQSFRINELRGSPTSPETTATRAPRCG